MHLISIASLLQLKSFEKNILLFVETPKIIVTNFISTFVNNKYIYWCDDIHHDQRLYQIPIYQIKIPLISAFGNCIKNAHTLHHYAQDHFILSDINVQPEMKLLMSGSGFYNDSIYDFRNWVLQKAKNDSRIHVLQHHQVYEVEYAKYIHRFVAAFTSTLNDVYSYIFAKVFEIPAVGTLLLIDDRIELDLQKLGFWDMQNCITVNKLNFDLKS